MKKGRKWLFTGLLIVLALFLVLFALRALFPNLAEVYFDNGLGTSVTVHLDSKKLIAVDPHTTAKLDIPGGTHLVEVYDSSNRLIDKALIYCRKFDLFLKTRYIFNIASANNYALYSVAYGGEAGTGGRPRTIPPKSLAREHFFRYPASYGSLNSGFPREVSVRKGQSSLTLQVVGHEPVHPSFPCCTQMRQSMGK
ncbi:MAG: hypothetical protein RDV48_00335 [Candidatus Eremiobacteraeota bacterium]|nr:hypothetical protein [Candidatus Eremiobacteraeota bacterium]